MAYKFDIDTNPNQTLYPPVTYPNDTTPRQTYSDVRLLVGGDSVFAGNVYLKGDVRDKNNLVVDVASNNNLSLFACKDNVTQQVLVGGAPQQLEMDSGSAVYFSNIPNTLPVPVLDQNVCVFNVVAPEKGVIQQGQGGFMSVDWTADIKVVANASNAKLSLYVEQDGGTPFSGKCDYHLPPAGESICVNVKSFGITFAGGYLTRFYMVSDQACTVLVDNVQAVARMLFD
jgi:hypothetical protein